MIEQKKFIIHLYNNIGIISLIIGIFFLIFGMLNIGILPQFYEAQSGSTGFDSSFTILVNTALWVGFCAMFLLISHTFYFYGKDLENTKVDEKNINITIRFFLIAAFIAIGLAIYLLLLLINVVKPIQFFPHVLFAGEETLMDFSIVFNGLPFFLILSVILRVSEKFIKYGMKIGELQ